MATEKDYVDFFNKVDTEIAGLIAVSVVDLESGMTLAVRSNRQDFDLSTASAFNSEMVKMKLKTMKALGLTSTLEDMLLTLSDQIHLIRMISPTAFVYLVVDRAKTNLAIVRTVVAKHSAAIG